MAKRGEKTRVGGRWTEAKYFSFIRGALRKAALRYPAKTDALDAVKVRVEGKRHRFEYECAECNDMFVRADVDVDHIIPAGSLKKYSDLPGFVERLFCEPEDLQVLCKECHYNKTQAERKGE